jgi:hypothetical protein
MKHNVVLRFFYCAKGDTILLQALPTDGGPDEWALVDCHLTKVSGAHWRVRDLVEKEKIRRLKFVCLTHPDRDHYFGMCRLLQEYFYDRKKDRLHVDEFWDSGAEFSIFSAIAERMGHKAIKTELDDLYAGFLAKLIYAGKLEHQPMHRGTLATTDFGDFNLLSLSPRASRVDHFNQQGVDAILGASFPNVKSAREQSNALSVVLVLMHKTLPVNIVLGGDATTETWEEALEVWPKLLAILKRTERRFAAIKVSHHGAKTSLYPDLYQDCCWKRRTIAILTVGPNDKNHPHKAVLDLLKSRAIRTYFTCWRVSKASPLRSTLPLPGYRIAARADRAHKVEGYHLADIELRITPSGRLSVKAEYV